MSDAAATLAPAHRWGELSGGLPGVADLLESAIDEARALGASFADARLSETEELRLYAVSGRPVDERVEGNAGIGVRALVDGAWGFASIPLAGDDDGRRAARLAVAGARAAADTVPTHPTGRVDLPPCPPASGSYQTVVQIDP